MTWRDKAPIETIFRNAWITRGSRLHAVTRLKRQHWASLFTVSSLTMYVVTFGIAPVPISESWRTALSVGASLFILIISLIESARSYLVEAERLQQSAHELHTFQMKAETVLKKGGSANEAAVSELQAEYARTLKGCSENHSQIDFDRFRIANAAEFDLGLGSRGALVAWCSVREYWLFATLNAVPLVAALYAWGTT